MKDHVIQLPLHQMINEWISKEYGVCIKWNRLLMERTYDRDVIKIVFDEFDATGPFSSIKDLIKDCGVDQDE